MKLCFVFCAFCLILDVYSATFATKLPIVKLTVDSEPTRQKERHTGTLEVVGNGVFGDMAAVKVEDIHVRGNWTAISDWSKLPYKIKLAKKTDMFGMGKQKHWVLLANYFDPSLLNNRIASNLARAAGVLAMDSEWVELFINDEYRGVYQFCEHIRIDKNRVAIDDWEDDAKSVAEAIAPELEETLTSDWSWVTTRKVTYGGATYSLDDYPSLPKSYDLSGGYLVQFDHYAADADETTLTLNNYGRYLKMANTIVVQPKYLATNPEMCGALKRALEGHFQAIQSPDGYFNGRHYTETCDIDSMVGYWIVQTFTGNYDGATGSRYAYLDRGGKLTWGPAWDYSENAFIGCNYRNWTVSYDASSGEYRPTHTQISYVSKFGLPYGASDAVANPYPFWADDPYFCLRLWEAWHRLTPFFDDLLREGGTFDQYVAYLKDSGAVNQETFTCCFRDSQNAAWKYDPRTSTYEKMTYGELTSGLRSFLEQVRRSWTSAFTSVDTLERSLDSFWKYSADARARHPAFVADTANYGFTANCNCHHRVHDALTGHTDIFVEADTDVGGAVLVKPTDVHSVAVFVNGLSNGVYEVSHGAADITVPAAQLTNPKGRRNMIQFIGLDGKGARLGQSYALVEIADASVVSHIHDFSPWETNRVATCLEAGEATRACRAVDCPDTPYAETNVIAALGHDWGGWYTNLAPTVEMPGELRCDCLRTDCDAFKTQILEELDIDIGSVTPIPFGPTAEVLGIARGPFVTAHASVLTNIVHWANAYGKKVADLEDMDFNALGIAEQAYLLNVKPSQRAVNAARKAFRFEAFSVGEVPQPTTSVLPNGVIEVQGTSEFKGDDTDWSSPALPIHRFYRAVLKFRAKGKE